MIMRKLLYWFVVLLCVGCTKAVFREKWTRQKAPSTYVARFETTKGNFDVRVNREWASLAADRFYQLVKHHYYDSAIFYRVLPNGVAQFGGKDTMQFKTWRNYKLPDEKVIHGNKKGTISFASGGKDSRTTEVFINLADNPKLDTLNYKGLTGFPAFGEVTNGMDVVAALFSGYGEKPRLENMRTMYMNPPEFFQLYPKLDLIKRAYILK
jgi:homoserine O-acetyltransferase